MKFVYPIIGAILFICIAFVMGGFTSINPIGIALLLFTGASFGLVVQMMEPGKSLRERS